MRLTSAFILFLKAHTSQRFRIVQPCRVQCFSKLPNTIANANIYSSEAFRDDLRFVKYEEMKPIENLRGQEKSMKIKMTRNNDDIMPITNESHMDWKY